MYQLYKMSLLPIILIVICSLFVTSDAEEIFHPSKTKSPLQDEFDVIGNLWTDKTSWSLSVTFREPDYPLKSNLAVIVATEQWANSTQEIDQCKGYLAEFELAKKELPRLKELVGNFGLIGNGLGKFLYADTTRRPVRFARKDTSITLLLTGIASESVYNTLRTTSKSRAATVVQTMIIPSLRHFVDAFQGTRISRFGMCVVYGSKNFIDDSIVGNLEEEIVAFIVPISAATQFVKGRITEEELLEDSDVYLSDRDLRMDFKKVTLSFE